MHRLPAVTVLALLALPVLAGGKVVDLQTTDPDLDLGAAMLIARVDLRKGSGSAIHGTCILKAQVTDEDGVVYEPYASRCYSDEGGFIWFNGLPAGEYRITQFVYETERKYVMDEPGAATFEIGTGELTFAGSFVVALETKAMMAYKAHSTTREDSAGDVARASLVHHVFIKQFDPGEKKSKSALRDLAWVEWYRDHPVPEPPAPPPPPPPQPPQN